MELNALASLEDIAIRIMLCNLTNQMIAPEHQRIAQKLMICVQEALIQILVMKNAIMLIIIV